MFRKMTESVLRSQVVFFDSNPIGRIVTRFSKDISVFDLILTYFIVMITFGFLKLFVTIVVVAIISPIVLVPAFVMAIVMFCVMRFASPGLVEAQRLDSVLRGPMHSMFAMVVGGLVSFRAMSRLDFYGRGFKNEVAKGTHITFTYNGINRWVA